jgi:hypothetical protein
MCEYLYQPVLIQKALGAKIRTIALTKNWTSPGEHLHISGLSRFYPSLQSPLRREFKRGVAVGVGSPGTSLEAVKYSDLVRINPTAFERQGR